MSAQTETPTLANLELHPYLSEDGAIADEPWQGKVGIYAIFNAENNLQFVGYSRNVATSLRQHLVRQPNACHGFKVQTIDRPSRTLLEQMRQAWIAENGSVPPGNSSEAEVWTQPIDVKPLMTDAERQSLADAADELAKTKCIKQAARRVQAEVLERLAARGVTESLRFNPKLKEDGLLELK